MQEPALCQRASFWVLGIQERADPMRMDYDAFWNRFDERIAEVQPLAVEDAGYGVYFPADEEGAVDIFGGMAVAEAANVPEGLVLREVPAAQYAVFECGMSQIGATWGAIYGEWLPASAYEADSGKPCFEEFPPGCHEGTEPVRIFVPLQKKV